MEHHKKDIKDLQQAHERIRKTENEGLHRKVILLMIRKTTVRFKITTTNIHIYVCVYTIYIVHICTYSIQII